MVDGRPATREELTRIAVISRAKAALLFNVIEKVQQAAADGGPGALERIRVITGEAILEHRRRRQEQARLEGR